MAIIYLVLEQDKLLPHIEHLKSVLCSRKDAMCNALYKYCPDVKYTEPTGGYFLWLHLPDNMHAEQLLKEAVSHHGVAFTPGTRCSLGTDDEDVSNVALTNCARLSFAFYSEEEISTGIQRLCAAVALQSRNSN